MQYRKYGKLGYEVSLLGMGCMRLPRVYTPDGKAEVDRDKATEMIHYAIEHGVNYFDTAYGYHNQTSETVLGEALAGGWRQRVKIATKQPFGVMKTQSDIRKNLENTLKKLQTDFIDVYLVHNISAESWDAILERRVLDEYEKFREEGLIGAIAFSYHGQHPGFARVLGGYDWDMCQVQQNLLDVDHEVTAQAIADAGQKGCALVVMEPLRGGGLANAPAPVQALYDGYPVKRSAAEWAFRHVINYPEVSTILSGMTTMEQLQENIAIFSKPDALPGCLTAPEKEILRRAKEAYESLAAIPCTACEYCMPCPNGVNIPGVFSRYNDGAMFENFEPSRRSYMFMTNAGASADRCVACGECEPKCPQQIPIIQELQRAHTALQGWIE